MIHPCVVYRRHTLESQREMKEKGRKKYHANSNLNKAGVAILILNILQNKNCTDKEHFIIIKRPIQENISYKHVHLIEHQNTFGKN